MLLVVNIIKYIYFVDEKRKITIIKNKGILVTHRSPSQSEFIYKIQNLPE